MKKMLVSLALMAATVTGFAADDAASNAVNLSASQPVFSYFNGTEQSEQVTITLDAPAGKSLESPLVKVSCGKNSFVSIVTAPTSLVCHLKAQDELTLIYNGDAAATISGSVEVN